MDEVIIEKCDVEQIHVDVIESIKNKMPKEQIIYDLADLFKVFGDATRIKILCILLEKEICVCDIANLLDMSQSAISHQLRVLKQARLVKYRREGRVVYYSLADNHIQTILAQGLDHVYE